jgi:hypothetical protein
LNFSSIDFLASDACLRRFSRLGTFELLIGKTGILF